MTLLALIAIAVLVCVFCAVNGRRNRRAGRDEGLKIGYESGSINGWNEAHERMAKACNVRPDALNIAIIHREVLNQYNILQRLED